MHTGPENHGIFPNLDDGIMKDGRTCVQEVAGSPISEIQKFCQEYDISGHSFYLTVWSLVLRAFAETDSVCIGFGDFRTSCAELDHAPLKALHSTLSPQSSISQILRGFKYVESEASLNNQETDHNTAVVLFPEAIDPSELSWLGKSNYSLLMAVSFSDSTSMPEKLSLVYLSSSLPRSHAENLSSNITQAIQQVLAHPTECIKNIELFSPLNKSTVFRWNRMEQKAASLLEVIHGHAKYRPDHPAICAWDGAVSYSELEMLATQWASYLQSQGVKPECLVPIVMDHSKWAIIGEIAILKAGGAFVPIDPSHPVSRLECIIQQTNAKIALSSAHLVDKLSNLVDIVIAISDETTSGLPKGRQDAVNPVSFDHTAYVLFTSGTTGRPKGCVVKYRALSDVVNQTTALKIGHESRVLQFASYTYGMSLIEIHCTLAVGATICIPSEDDRLNALNSAIRSMQVTWALLTPSTTLSIAESVEYLHTLVIAGEPMAIDYFRSLADKVELLQAFGLTEWSGICCVSQRISSETDMRVIGRSPTANLWLIDPTDSNKLAPVGAVAELLVEGPALADGYLGDTHQTVSAFVKGPRWLPVSTSARIYKTGDLVRYTADGNVRYIARKDSQVKIRGMRVELPEVEYQIRQAFPLLEKAIVEAAATKSSNGILVLVAFLYSGNRTDLSGRSFLHMIDMVKKSLGQTLPDYMWPSVYIPLHSVPLTMSRKVDRKALRHRIQTSTRKELEGHQSSFAYIAAPQTDVERQLHQFVAEVLHLELLSFGMGQNFISLGGDSVTAMLLVNKCKKHGYRVTVGAILQAQAISDIASLLQTSITSPLITSAGAESSHTNTTVELQSKIYPESSGYAPIPRLSHSGPVEQSFSQARIWFLEELHPESTWYLLPYATRLKGSLQLDALETALSALKERHEILRTTFASSNGIGLQIVNPFQAKPLRVIDIHSGSNAELMTALHQQQMTSIDLTKESWRFTVFRLSPKDHVLSIVLHHIISDGWSLDIFIKALEAYYSAAIRGQPLLSQAEPLQIQYRDFSIWQRQEQTSVHQKQLAYWVRQLDGSQPAEFQCDKQRPAMLSGIAGCQDVKVDGSLYQDLKRFCRSNQVTPFTVLLAAFRATHYRLTGANDAIIGIPSAARTRPELEGLIGYFGNVQCIRTKIENRNQSFQQLVHQVQSVTTASFENQDVPFDKIVSRLLKDRDVSRNPLVQVTFVLHSQANFGQLHLEGLKTEHLRLPQVSRLDLEFHLYPGEECLQGNILYSVDLFNPETIHAMLLVFYDVLREGLRQPDTDISSLPLTDGYSSLYERGLIYSEHKARSQGLSIIDIFYQQVAAHRNQIAVRDTHTQLTYSELDQRSAMLATWLTNCHSFAEETPVGVFANRSCESIIAVLGILKAGLAYVPLDIDAPLQRTETILSCLPSCQLVLLASGLMVPPIYSQSTRFAYITDSFFETAEEVNEFLRETPPPCSTSLAYILFTSGTTGKPKGVMVEHQGVIRLAKDPEIVTHSLDFKIASYMLNPAFDASGFEIYATLLNGGTLVCIDKNVVWDYTALETTLVKQGVRRAYFTPAMLKQCLISSPAIMGVLDILYVGGDKLDPEDIVKARRFGKIRIFNVYGPTENTIVSTRYYIPMDEAGVNGIPIGRSIDNSGAYVTDPNLRLVPIGVMGELVVTGLGLARGYTNSELNIGRFVTIYVGGKAVRAYRTGDMVRYRPSDAQLEFVGRMDQQVKIRGHRIEPAEIDNTLLLNSSVNAAVTVVQTQGDQEQELVSFVTVQDTGPKFEQFDDQIENEHVNAWTNLAEGDDYYGNLGAVQRDTLGRDFLGWVSMYDGEPIDKDEMNEWLEDTIAAILHCGPTRVLEIGTGTGMVLFNLIGSLQRYFGLEPSTQAVGFVQEAVHWVPDAARKVHIQSGTAADLADVKGAGPIDLAIINSVVQYFPSVNYLIKVIKDLIHLQDVKCIFFGDIRSYALYQEFQVSNVLHLYGHTVTVSDFRQKMTEIARLEKEFLVDPAFFTTLATELPDLIEHVEILPKQMKTTNELSCYRYTAILHVKRPSHPLIVREIEQSSWVDFEARGLNYQSLLQLLKTPGDSSILAVSNIPYRRTIIERYIVDLLQDLPLATGSAGWSKDVCKQAQVCPALAAVDLINLAQQTGWQVEISWARQRSQRGGLDAIFHHLEPHHKGARVLFRFPTDQHQCGLPGASSNDPLALQLNQRIENGLLENLRAKLPSYMVPKMVRVLDRMPINNIGKVDRHALGQRADIASSARATRTKSLSRNDMSFTNDIEHALWEEFTSVLGVEVGIADSFFDHGGHSIMATKLVSRINERLHSTIRVSDLFQSPTISRLGERVRGSGVPSSFTFA